ncbi:hypothetical protein ACWDR1_07375 [Streptosporangium sandarakinum]
MDLTAYQKFQACFHDVKRARHSELKDAYRVVQQEDEPLRRCLTREHRNRLVLGVFPADGRTGAFAAAGPRLIQRYRMAQDIARPRGIPHAEHV